MATATKGVPAPCPCVPAPLQVRPGVSGVGGVAGQAVSGNIAMSIFQAVAESEPTVGSLVL